MPSVCSNRMDTEGKFINHIINELDGILLIMSRINSQGSDPDCVINGHILKASDSVPTEVSERYEFDISLDVDFGTSDARQALITLRVTSAYRRTVHL